MQPRGPRHEERRRPGRSRGYLPEPPRLLRMNDPAPVAPRRCDVLVVGGGPSGAACAYWLASAGHDVVARRAQAVPPREDLRRRPHPPFGPPARGHGPRPTSWPAPATASSGLRSHGFGRTLELTWPEHPDLPGYGYVITRRDLDAMVAERAGKAGATVWDGTEAVEPVVEAGLVRGARVKTKPGGDDEPESAQPAPGPRCPPQHRRQPVEVRARYTVVADGANSRFGRSLGTSRNRAYPLGMAIRGYWTSPRHDEPWIDSWLDIRDKAGNVLPGYGWIFPVGDGRINVGIGLLSTFNQWKAVNTTHLLQQFAEYAPPSWGIRAETACGPATGGRLPMGLSVGPHAGPTWLVVGDAGGTINPFNGEGIAYAYESGRLAADAVHLALTSGDGLALQTYQERLDADLRPLLQGGPGLRAHHRPARADEESWSPPGCAAGA